MSPRRHRSQSGFALLLVFAMAAIVAIMLFLELPRVAFEAQRVREEVLIQRGEQYQRAIRLFYRRFQRYPPTIEALENTNNIRFLRRRYKDPMTGKDEWRLIHAGPGGIFTDSLTQKPPQKTDDKQISSLDSMASTTTTTDTPVVSMVPRRRPSEGTQVPMPGAPGGVPSTDFQSPPLYPPPQDQPEQPPQPEPWQTGQAPGQPIQPGQPGQPGQPYPSLMPGQSGQPGQPGPYPPRFLGQPGYQPPIPGFQPGGLGPGQYPPSNIPVSGPGQPPFAPPPYGSSSLTPTGAGPSNTPVPEMIQTILTQPSARPGGLGGGITIGAGIAGVASTLKAEGIKSFNDHTKYNEWEFIYDPRKDISMQMLGMPPGALPAQNLQTTTPAPSPSTSPSPSSTPQR